MSKRIIFVISILISVVIIIVLFILKFTNTQQSNLPTLSEHVGGKNSGNSIRENDITQESYDEALIKLNSDETYISSVSTDLNEDGLKDEIIAVKKSLNPSIYLILAIQEKEKNGYKKTAEIKTSVLVPTSIFFYTLQLQDSLPAIVCTGVGLNREQILSIYMIKEDSQKNISFENIATFSADIQVQLQDKRTTTIGSLLDYSIETYNFESEKENNLEQIRAEYKWNASLNRFIKVSEEKMQGKRIEDSILKELRSGSQNTYKQYLFGLWYMPKTVGENTRYFYYDKNSNRFIFYIGEIEEIYNVQNMFVRHYGFSIVTDNSAISSIKRRIEIDIKAAEEIQVRVIEDVASLKINATSNWNGLYRKKQNVSTPSVPEEEESYTELKDVLYNSKKTWITDNVTLKTYGNSYTMKLTDREEKGTYNIITVNTKNVIQTKSITNDRAFYIVELENEKNSTTEATENKKPAVLKLIPSTFTLSKIEPNGNKPLVFKELIE